MRFFKKKPAPEAPEVPEVLTLLQDKLRLTEEQNCALHKHLQEERDRSAGLRAALVRALDESWSLQKDLEEKSSGLKLMSDAFIDKHYELETLKAQNLRLLQERTQANAYICLQNTKIYCLQEQIQSHAQTYTRLKDHTTRLEQEVSTATHTLEEQKQVSTRALDLKEQDISALQEELKTLQEEMTLLREKSMEELKAKVRYLQNELKVEHERNQAALEELCLYKQEQEHLKDLLTQTEEQLEQVHEEKCEMNEEYRGLLEEAQRNVLYLRQELNLRIQTSARLEREKEETREQQEEQREVSRVTLDLMEQEVSALKEELREERDRSEFLQEEMNMLQEEVKQERERRTFLQQELSSLHKEEKEEVTALDNKQ